MIRKIPTRSLKIGWVALEAIITPSGQILAPAGEILTRQIINKMKLYNVDYAVVDVELEPDQEPEFADELISSTPTVMAPPPTTPPPPTVIPASAVTVQKAEEPKVEKPKVDEPKTRVEESKTHSQKVVESNEFKDFQLDYFKALDYLKEVFEGVSSKKGYAIDEEALIKSIAPLFISRNTITEVFDMLHHMHALNDTVYAHCINVALIARMIGRWLHLDQRALDVLTCCGLLHDIGKLSIPDEVLNKPGKLTDEEFELIKSHPKMGYEMLRHQDIDNRIKQAALMHHERYDGSGYPNGLTSEFLPDFAMIIAIADVYDAMTAARSYRVPLCPFQVIENFERDGYQKYHTKYIYIFLNRIASTYQNNRIMLNDGRGAKIVMLNQNQLSKPVIQFDDGECMDLSTQKEFYITKIL